MLIVPSGTEGCQQANQRRFAAAIWAEHPEYPPRRTSNETRLTAMVGS
jgi:hypothetical protein